MHIQHLIAEIKNNQKSYFKKEKIIYLEYLMKGYTAAAPSISPERIDRTFVEEFQKWLRQRAGNLHSLSPMSESIPCLIPDDQDEFAAFFELSELFFGQYGEKNAEMGAEASVFLQKQKTVWEMISMIAMKPALCFGVPNPNPNLALFYYYLAGYCLAYRDADVPHEEMQENFCDWFGEWLSHWFQEKKGRESVSASKFWYDDIRHITPEGESAFGFFCELKESFFDDYFNAEGFFSWREKAEIIIESPETLPDSGCKPIDIILRVDGKLYCLSVVSMRYLKEEYEFRGCYNPEPNMVVVKEMKQQEIRKTIQNLYRKDYFKKILPL